MAHPAKCAAWLLLLLAGGVSIAQQASKRDIDLVQQKTAAAQQYFNKVWSDVFASRGYRFNPPRVVAFSGSLNTGCGLVQAGNGFFCSRDNSVYLDAAFLAELMEAAAAALHTDGDYAALVVAAHEFGHVVAAQLNVVYTSILFREYDGEQVADCMAGAITRQGKLDGLLEPGDLAEALYSLGQGGDEPAPIWRRLPSHGVARDRQSAFRKGYYGASNVCSTRLGAAAPVPALGGIRNDSLQGSFGKTNGSNRTCLWWYGMEGLRVRNSSPRPGESCLMNLMPTTAAIPAHARIEVTTALPGGSTGTTAAGIYYGDGRPAAKPAHYGFQTNGQGEYDLVDTGDLSASYGYLPRDPQKIQKPPQPNTLTLDIHHEGGEVFFLEYVNNAFMGFGSYRSIVSPFGLRLQSVDEAGLYIRLPGTEAVFRNFRVLALPD